MFIVLNYVDKKKVKIIKILEKIICWGFKFEILWRENEDILNVFFLFLFFRVDIEVMIKVFGIVIIM